MKSGGDGNDGVTLGLWGDQPALYFAEGRDWRNRGGLGAFVKLGRDPSEEAVCAHASAWGPLGLCECGLPYCHEGQPETCSGGGGHGSGEYRELVSVRGGHARRFRALLEAYRNLQKGWESAGEVWRWIEGPLGRSAWDEAEKERERYSSFGRNRKEYRAKPWKPPRSLEAGREVWLSSMTELMGPAYANLRPGFLWPEGSEGAIRTDLQPQNAGRELFIVSLIRELQQAVLAKTTAVCDVCGEVFHVYESGPFGEGNERRRVRKDRRNYCSEGCQSEGKRGRNRESALRAATGNLIRPRKKGSGAGTD